MKLYIHFGINKTASSFLQTICAQNRSYLQESGYYFPRGDREKDLINGRISPGNTQQLDKFLVQGNAEKVSDVLRVWRKEGQNIGCDKVLISGESLINAFARKKCLEKLCRAAKSEGFEELSALAFLRDPVEHCLSTYKHRAKRGTIPDFEAWVKADYETMVVLQGFIIHFRDFDIDWNLRKYSKDANKMAKAFFIDWLDLEVPSYRKDQRVNSSLSLSELLVIRQFGNEDKKVLPFLYDAFTRLASLDKSVDKALLTSHKQIIYDHLSNYSDLIALINQHLPEEEQLLLKGPDPNGSPADHETASLSLTQLQAIAGAVRKSYTFRSRLRGQAKWAYQLLRKLT